MKLRRDLPVLLLLAVLVAAACGLIFSLGFLNDEWLQLGYVRGVGIFAGFMDKLSLLDILIGKGRVLGGMINNVFFYYFDANPIPFAVFAVIFHLVNSFLVYLLTWEITVRKPLAIISACIFSVPAAAHQAFSLLAASVQTIGGMTFVLAAVLTAVRGTRTGSRMQQISAWIFAYTAFLFKESSFFVFPVLLAVPYLVRARKKLPGMKHLLWLIPFIGIGLIKIFQLLGSDTAVIGKAFLNMALYPLITLSQFFIPFRFMLKLSLSFAGYFYSFLAGASEANQAASVVVSDLLSVIFSCLLILIASYVYAKQKQLRIFILFAVGWYVLSFAPVAVFLPERNTSYIESRYLYFSFYPVAVLAGLIFLELKAFVARISGGENLAWGITLLLLSLFLYKQITLVHREIAQSIVYADATRQVMDKIRAQYPVLPDKPIFLVEGDKTFYYAHINFPFQEGAGYMLGITFRDYPVIPKELLGISFLAKNESEGYKEVGNKGYGYFNSRDHLIAFLQGHPHISTNQIVAMYYYGFEGRLVDTTASAREFVRANR